MCSCHGHRFIPDDLLRYHRHASIDPAVRAARGLPEDLIRLCVGIEDPHDLLDDLERALIDAGAIALDASQNKYVRAPDDDALTLAVQKLNLDVPVEEKEWFVSAPGKVILFGEHAVVHGVVSWRFYFCLCPGATKRLEPSVWYPQGWLWG